MSQFSYPQASPASFSGGGADIGNLGGTPNSRAVAFSPSVHSAKSPTALLHTPDHDSSEGNRLVFSPTQSSGGGFRTTGRSSDDPFVTPSTKSKAADNNQRLSATASSFRPVYGKVSSEESGDAHARPAVEKPDKAGPSQNSGHISPALSTELMLSRCMEISCLSQSVSAADIEAYQAKLASLGSPSQGNKQVFIRNNKAYIRFANIHDACVVHRNVQLCGNNWIANFISPLDFSQLFGPHEKYGTHDGQLDMLAVLLHNAPIGVDQVEPLVFKLLQSEGDLFAFQKDARSEEGTVKAIIEYADVNVSLAVAGKLNGVMVDGLHMRLDFYQPNGHTGRAVTKSDGIATPMATPMRYPPDGSSAFQTQAAVPYPRTQPPPSNNSLVPGRRQPTPPAAGIGGPPQMALVPMMLRNPYTPGAPMIFDPYGQQGHAMTPMGGPPYVFPSHGIVGPAAFDGGRSMSMAAHRFGNRRGPMRPERGAHFNSGGHHNQVDVNRIRNGNDVRTTIMLRNIPNKVDQRMLKAIIDESSWGKYDFMYLRIDFANDCNVGYAFINFADPLDIIDFANAKDNKRWNCFRSDKVAEISYATIQGRDCLVQKFRNSSVMLEPPHYRPKLYYTNNTAPERELIGKEEEFPEPDNPSKMKRSCENAEHVGLFTPHLNQYYRDEQRRRRSQYDRGTRMAALEELDYDTSVKRGMYITH